MLKGKTVLLGITGGIACYKAAALTSALVKQHCNVQVIMTKNAMEFISPLTFESLTGNRTVTDTFDRNHSYQVEHISLADQADLVMIAPATANVLAKLAHGIADDMLTTTVLACNCPKIAAPAMNTKMYQNPVTQDNLKTLEKYGWEIITPASGRLACGAVGLGKMPEPEDLLESILHRLAHERDMEGLRVLVTAGPTQEALDPVRYLTNHSTGKMGYAIARAAAARGAQVTLVTGPTQLRRPAYVETVEIVTAGEMFEEVTSRSAQQDIIIKAAAVADYRPAQVSGDKIKKSEDGSDLALSLERTQDILGWLGEHKHPGQFLCGFSMETRDVLENSRRKLVKKNLDLIAANSIREEGAGFGVDTNHVTLIAEDGERPLPLQSKDEVANSLLDEILRRRGLSIK
ncbi:bifunctional phosphopantothenoylcysteine decarboxylase/phosphopantothenate--cysteine ligase CoaBC [Angelakisella massiliensis]|uniref:bifunctional phosphopantothenoylcysteine decarboxylase/phosphopantothenate--cysteine ligase CoaBC n=1 Tax=Angelakisella massiliensis TaxID=1871018 RepID=UPI0008F94E44|nr:bifunctional phosphopantothenoylcysteine decarboxylase/phosphopantothenate--cysteine ligase CoaBC [Angelakisella massiliensis]